jgi:hypothetical protein
MATIPCPAGSGGNLAAFGDSDYTATSTVGGTTQLPFCDPGPGPALSFRQPPAPNKRLLTSYCTSLTLPFMKVIFMSG